MSDYNFCPSCGRELPEGSAFCPSCGRPLHAGPPPDKNNGLDLNRLLIILGAWGSLLLLGLLAFNAYIAFWISPEILANIGDGGVDLFIIVPLIIDLVRLTGPAAEVYYVLVLAAFISSFILLIWRSRGFPSELKGGGDGERTPLFALTTLFAAVYLFNFSFYLLVTMLGGDFEVPPLSSLEDWRLLFVLLNAAVYEEVVSRVLLIGVPLAAVVLLGRREGRWYRALFGGTGIGNLERFLIVFSALMFSLGHLEGWDAWKVLPTLVGGLALGYLFVKYGVYASIMLHFTINYLTAPLVYSDSIGMTVALGLLLLLFIGMGVPFLIIYTRRALASLIGERMMTFSGGPPSEDGDEKKEEYPLPNPVCPSCGQEGAVFSNGELVCPRCGRRY